VPSKQRAPADPKSGGPSLSLHGLGWALALATPSFFPDLVDINNTPAEIANSFDARAGFLTPGAHFRVPATRRRAGKLSLAGDIQQLRFRAEAKTLHRDVVRGRRD
jgi:hypothetical protein